jgi:hypothetical protein
MDQSGAATLVGVIRPKQGWVDDIQELDVAAVVALVEVERI